MQLSICSLCMQVLLFFPNGLLVGEVVRHGLKVKEFPLKLFDQLLKVWKLESCKLSTNDSHTNNVMEIIFLCDEVKTHYSETFTT